MPQFDNIINTNVLATYLHDGWWDNTSDHRTILSAIMKRGNVKTESGTGLTWNVRVKKNSVATYGVGSEIEITQKDQTIQCYLPWSLLTSNDAITKEELRMAASNQGLLYSRRDRMIEKLKTDFEDSLNARFMTDDYNATTNALAGFASFFGDANAAGAADNEETASDTYATHSTALNGITAVSGALADAWTPTLVNYKSTALGAGGATWAANCLEALTYAKDQITFGTKDNEQPDFVVTTKSMLSRLKNKIGASQRIVVVDGSPSPGGLGFKGAVVHDGLEVMPDEDCPSEVAFMLNSRQLFLHVLADPAPVAGSADASTRSKKGKLFELSSDYDIRTNMHVFRMDMSAQLRTNPRYQCKLAAFS